MCKSVGALTLERCELEPFLLVGPKGRPRIFTVENVGLAAQHGYISPAAETNCPDLSNLGRFPSSFSDSVFPPMLVEQLPV